MGAIFYSYRIQFFESFLPVLRGIRKRETHTNIEVNIFGKIPEKDKYFKLIFG